ncbi:MAG TPA: adenylosuccinate synthetase, partial [Chlamydiales bacterium]|nr:adenylosuccinate synthetase [Chlamydiales bacterium]
MNNVTIVGLGWGDEGKGKIVDYLAQDMTCVVRCQGGNNAGHTIVVGNDEFKLHLIPSGILHPHVRCFLGAGVVIDLHTLKEEIAALDKRGIDVKGRLFISPYAHVILPTHRLLDHASEMLNGIGTTGKGIGPCYADAVLRKGVRIADLLSSSANEKVKEIITSHNRLLETMHNVKGIDIPSATNQLFEDLEFIQDFISHVEQDLMKAYQKGDRILFEGAQGVLLDRTFGTYPFVTSSSTTPAGMLAAVGMPLTASGNIVGIIKAYATRVGSGPFPTELGADDPFPFE